MLIYEVNQNSGEWYGWRLLNQSITPLLTWHFVSFLHMQFINYCFVVVVVFLKKQSSYNHMFIDINESVVSGYVNFIVVSFNLLWANASLLMCIISPSNLKGNYLSDTETAIENSSRKYVLGDVSLYITCG